MEYSHRHSDSPSQYMAVSSSFSINLVSFPLAAELEIIILVIFWKILKKAFKVFLLRVFFIEKGLF